MSRGGKRANAGRKPFNSLRGKRNIHGITLDDFTWNGLCSDAKKLNLSVSQFIEKIYKNYKGEINL